MSSSIIFMSDFRKYQPPVEKKMIDELPEGMVQLDSRLPLFYMKSTGYRIGKSSPACKKRNKSIFLLLNRKRCSCS
jgi:hypothetical protein